MRILVIHNRYKIRSGENKVFLSELRMLKEFGHEIEVVLFDNKDIDSFFSKMKASVLSIYNPFSSKLIRKKISEFKPDLIHIHNFFPLISPSVFFRRTRRKIPIVLTLHNYRLICANAILFRDGRNCEECIHKVFPLNPLLHKCYRNSFFQTLNITLVLSIHKLIGTWNRKIDRFIALTEFQKKKILDSSLGLKEDQVVVKPNFVFDAEDWKCPKKDNYFLYIGRLEVNKGVETLLSSFRSSPYELKIIGDGSMKEVVLKISEECENIEYSGTRDNQYVIEQLLASKGLIFPSFCYEGFPIVIAEAFSCGTPVISSDIGSQAEVVKDEFNGLHFRLGDSDDLTLKVKKLFEMKDNLMIQNARDTFVKLYSEKKNHNMLIKIYKDLIE